MKRTLKAVIVVFSLFACFFICFIPARADEDDPLIIVIDPGHGGKNLGAQYEEYTEKEMTMIVARAMKEELEKYDQVVVYLTHDTDADMSIEDRALFAKEKNADFLFCLHFNMSSNHDYFGAEVWVPAGGEYYAKGYSFAQIEMEELTGIGLYSRGIKTRLNDKGDNYYGILRYCSQQQIPSALIEHCHLDHAKDQKFYQQGEEQLKEFGRMDATAVAKYFGLHSTVLGIDYSDYPVLETAIPSGMVQPDNTEPDLCHIEVVEINEEAGEITIDMEAGDDDSYILYYNFSYDGGNTHSMPDAWPRTDRWNQSDQSHRLIVQVPFDTRLSLCAGVCNGFDVWTYSNEIILDPIADPERLRKEKQLEEEKQLEDEKRAPDEKQQPEKGVTKDILDEENGERASEILFIILIILGIIACIFFVSFFMSKMIFQLIRDNKKQ